MSELDLGLTPRQKTSLSASGAATMPDVADGTGNVIAWSAGVSGVSAAFAGIIASRATTPLSHNPWFILCIVIAVISFLVLLLVAPRSAWLWWRKRRSREHVSRSNVTANPSATYEGITLELVDQQWELWRGKAWIAEVQVRITNNTTPGRVITLMSPHLESDPGPLWSERPRLTQEEVDALARERLERSPLNPHMGLKPGESRIICVVDNVFLPYPESEDKPYCEFVVRDAEGETYALPITGQGSPGDRRLPELMRLRNVAMRGWSLRAQIQGGTPSIPDPEPTYEGWTNRAARALKPWPSMQKEFQANRTAASDRDPAKLVQRMELLEEMLRIIEGRPHQDAGPAPQSSVGDPAETPQQPPALPVVRHLLVEGRSLQGDLDRAPTGTMPDPLAGRIEGWEMTARTALGPWPDLCRRFEAAPSVATQDVPATWSNRLMAHLRVLEAIEQELAGRV